MRDERRFATDALFRRVNASRTRLFFHARRELPVLKVRKRSPLAIFHGAPARHGRVNIQSRDTAFRETTLRCERSVYTWTSPLCCISRKFSVIANDHRPFYVVSARRADVKLFRDELRCRAEPAKDGDSRYYAIPWRFHSFVPREIWKTAEFEKGGENELYGKMKQS